MAPTEVFVYNDVLIPHERALRKPLPQWTGEVTESLDWGRKVLANDLAAGTTTLITCFNQAALMEVLFGRTPHAQELCTRALSWLDKLISQTGGLECYKNVFQPFVNLARLDRINGLWTEALSKLNVVQDALNLHSITLYRVCVPDDVLHLLLQDSQLAGILRNACTIERLKTLLKAGMYSAILDLAAERRGEPLLAQFVAEAEAIALCRAGEFDPALRVIEKWLYRSSCGNQPVFLFRLAETLAAAGRRETALAALLKLKGIFLRSRAKLGSEPLTLLNRLALLLRTSNLLLHLNAPTDSQELARLGYEASVAAGDVSLVCEFLNVLKRAGVQTVDGEEISEFVRHTKARAWYGVAQPGCPVPERDRAVRRLNDLFQNLVALSDQTSPASA